MAYLHSIVASIGDKDFSLEIRIMNWQFKDPTDYSLDMDAEHCKIYLKEIKNDESFRKN
jgi:hypothetical protein